MKHLWAALVAALALGGATVATSVILEANADSVPDKIEVIEPEAAAIAACSFDYTYNSGGFRVGAVGKCLTSIGEGSQARLVGYCYSASGALQARWGNWVGANVPTGFHCTDPAYPLVKTGLYGPYFQKR